MAVQELEKNKKYRIDVPIGYNGNKRIRHIETFYGGKKEAVLRENEIKAQVKNHTYVNKSKTSFSNLIDEYFKIQKPIWSPKTYNGNVYLSKLIKEKIGHIKVQDINSRILEGFYNYLRTNTSISDNTVQHYYTFINTVLNKAVKWDYILTNPNQKIEKPKFIKKEIECYSAEEVEQLIKVLKNEPLKYQAIIILALDSSARRGELTGLTWEDIDFSTHSLKINKSTQYIKDMGIYEKTTKTPFSIRTIYIAEATIKILKQYQKEQIEKQLKLGSKWRIF